ncbi:MAG: alpha/beta hydrolase [Deltaproteobacteria bacterium]|nr:alpha/beta hydrolase [Deltaproteobacteria bacterium]
MTTRIVSPQAICIAAELVSRHPPIAVDELDDVLTPEVLHSCNGKPLERADLQALAALIDPKRLDQADLFAVLANPDQMLLQSEQRMVRKALDLPESDPSDLVLNFNTVPFKWERQIAYITIRPPAVKNIKPPLLFLTGLHHKSAVYLQTLMELARREGRTIVTMDLPGMGGSRLPGNASVYAGDLTDAAVAVIKAAIPEGTTFDLMAHSLGTIPARELYEMGSVARRRLGLTVLIAPVPAQREQNMGYLLDAGFAKEATARNFINGGDLPPMRPELFFQQHDTSSRKWLLQVTGKERYSTSLWSILSQFLAVDRRPLTAVVGVDHELRLVFPVEDRLIPIDIDSWVDRRGIYFVPNADHSFMAGPSAAVEEQLATLQAALNDPLSAATPRFQEGNAYRTIRRASLFGAAGTIDQQVGLFGIGAARLGLFPAGLLGIDAEAGISSMFGTAAEMAAHVGLGLQPLDLPIWIGGGARGAVTTDYSTVDLYFDAYTRAEIRFREVLGAGVMVSLLPIFRDPAEPTHKRSVLIYFGLAL